MQVFLSWSGDRSRLVAEALARWLRQVIQTVEPWLSADIEKGTHWEAAVRRQLSESRVGVICLTTDNLDSRWLLFEAGALSNIPGAHVCTFLLGIDPSAVKPPLAQFQHTTTARTDVLNLVKTINDAAAHNNERPLKEEVLESVFTTFWPHLEKQLAAAASAQFNSDPTAQPRSQADVLMEILVTVRGLVRGQAEGAERERRRTAGQELRDLAFAELQRLGDKPDMREMLEKMSAEDFEKLALARQRLLDALARRDSPEIT